MESFQKQFIENLKSIPLAYEDLENDPFLRSITYIVHAINEKKEKNINSAILQLIEEKIKSKSVEKLPRFFLIISELQSISLEIRTFALDAMLFFENDLYGEYKNFEEVQNGFLKIKNAHKEYI